MSSAVMLGDCSFTLLTKRNRAFSFSGSAELSRSCNTLHTSSSLPSSSAATAACDFSQNGQSF